VSAMRASRLSNSSSSSVTPSVSTSSSTGASAADSSTPTSLSLMSEPSRYIDKRIQKAAAQRQADGQRLTTRTRTAAVADVTLSFEDGTIRVAGGTDLDLPVDRDPRSKTGRAPAVRYAALVAALDDLDVDYDDRVLAAPALDVASAYELREYQRTALDAWRANDDQGCL